MEKVLKAITDINFKKTEELLKAGADVNTTMEECQDTLLHISFSSEVTRLLLLYGASVNSRNSNGETPLHCATIHQKGLKVIRELLKYGADVNAVDNEGKTPLYNSVCYRGRGDDRVCIWMELLANGADMNMSCLEYYPYRHYCTPLCKAIENEDHLCAKFLIKMSLIENFKGDCTKIIDFNSYIRIAGINQTILFQLSSFQDDCIAEIVKMRTHRFKSNCSLYRFIVTKKTETVKPLYDNNNNITDKEILSNYPIYHDVILSSLELCLERATLLEDLKNLEICVRVKSLSTLSRRYNRNIIILPADCLFMIAEYLTNEDLSNFIETFN